MYPESAVAVEAVSLELYIGDWLGGRRLQMSAKLTRSFCSLSSEFLVLM